MEQPHSRQWKTDHLLSPHRQISRIGLISPYTGGNLGNAAIISALVANMRHRIPGVEIVGITLNPGDTRYRHGIEAVPITTVPRSDYSQFISYVLDPRPRQRSKPSRIKEWLKRIPLMPKPSRIKEWLERIPLLRNLRRAIRICTMELAHIAAAVRVVRRLDRLIVAGGGALDDFWGGPWGHPWSMFKWGVVSRICGVPFMFVSVGKCQLQRPLSRFFVRAALRLAEYRSYRDPESKTGVQTLIDARKDPVCPDLAFSYPCPVLPNRPCSAPQNDRLTVGVGPIAYCDPRVSPLKDEGRYSSYLARMAEMVNWLLAQGHHILFFTTDDIDAAPIDEVQAGISAGLRDADAIRILPRASQQSVDSFLRDISLVDLTIASRLHGVILSHLNATPVLALSPDPKVDAHMKLTDQKDYCLSIRHWEFETIIARFTALKSARQREKDRLRSAAMSFRRELDVQYDRILSARRSMPLTGEYQDQIDGLRLSGFRGLQRK
jgi:polysaccharide pyruvyl transferase WcaK-like protein